MGCHRVEERQGRCKPPLDDRALLDIMGRYEFIAA
jgi:hypothetical protein